MLPSCGQPRNKRCHLSFPSLKMCCFTVCTSSLAVGERVEDLSCQHARSLGENFRADTLTIKSRVHCKIQGVSTLVTMATCIISAAAHLSSCRVRKLHAWIKQQMYGDSLQDAERIRENIIVMGIVYPSLEPIA